MSMLTREQGKAIQDKLNSKLKASGMPSRVEAEVIVKVTGTRVLLRLREKESTIILPDTGSQGGLA